MVCVPEKVMLAGRRSVLDSISALNISDPLLTLKDKDKDVTTIINIKKYLPSGIQFADQLFSGNISVTAGIEPITTKKLEIPVRNFAAGNKPDDMDVTIKEFEPLLIPSSSHRRPGRMPSRSHRDIMLSYKLAIRLPPGLPVGST